MGKWLCRWCNRDGLGSRALSVRAEFGADSVDGECGARLEMMSRMMLDAEGAVVVASVTVERRSTYLTEVCAIECSDGVPGIQDPSFDGGGVGVGGRPTRHGYPCFFVAARP